MDKYLAAAKIGAILQTFAPDMEGKVVVIRLFNSLMRTTEDQCLRGMCRALSDGIIFGKWPWTNNVNYSCPDTNCGWCNEHSLCIYPLCPRNAQHVDTTQFIGR